MKITCLPAEGNITAPAVHMNKSPIKIPVLLGPTAVGKTELAVQLCEEMGWEVVSCDSRQIYRYMDIGTAKPSPQQLRAVKHHLVDIMDPSEPYSAYRFSQDCSEIMRKSAGEGKTVLICGGTGLYFKSLSEGMGPQIETDSKLRSELMEEGKRGSIYLYEKLSACDPESAARIHQNDLQRIVRALAVYYQTGSKLSCLNQQNSKPDGFEFIIAKLYVDRTDLYKRINDRVLLMFKNGLLEEFHQLTSMGCNESSPGMQCVGYRELFPYTKGLCSQSVAQELIQRNTRRYAKRQITWFAHQTAGFECEAKQGYTALKNYYLRSLSL